MQPDQLAARCAEAITESTKLGLPNGDASVLLVLPYGWRPPPKFPRGKTAQRKEDGSRVAYFNAINVLAWLAANGAVEVETIVSKQTA